MPRNGSNTSASRPSKPPRKPKAPATPEPSRTAVLLGAVGFFLLHAVYHVLWVWLPALLWAAVRIPVHVLLSIVTAPSRRLHVALSPVHHALMGALGGRGDDRRVRIVVSDPTTAALRFGLPLGRWLGCRPSEEHRSPEPVATRRRGAPLAAAGSSSSFTTSPSGVSPSQPAADAAALMGSFAAGASSGLFGGHRAAHDFSLDQPYTAPLYNGHVGTILAHYKPRTKPKYRAEVIQAADGCDIHLDWALLKDNMTAIDTHRPLWRSATDATHNGMRPGTVEPCCRQGLGLVVVIPGLASDSASSYIESFVAHALRTHLNVVVVNARGMRPITPLTRPKFLSGAHTDDVRHIVRSVLTPERLTQVLGWPAPIALVGFSLGASVVAKFVGEEGDELQQSSAVVCAASVSAPWDFHEAFSNMRQPTQMLVYQAQLVAGLQRYLNNNKHVLYDESTGKGVGAVPWDWDHAMAVRTVHEFDECVVVPHHGWASRSDYYDEASSMQHLPNAAVPILCIATADDTVCGTPPHMSVWRKLVEANPNVCFAHMPAGGHLGFLQDPWREAARAANPCERMVLDYIRFVMVTSPRGGETTARSACLGTGA